MTTRRAVLALLPAAGLTACADNRVGVRETPSFYRDLSRPGSQLDLAMAATMLSGHRRNNGLGPVTVDPRLVEVAREMAGAMAARDDVSVSQRQPPLRERLARRGYTVVAAEENVSAGYRTLADAISGWRGSRPHDRVMRLANATHFGMAAVPAPASRFGVYWALVVANGR